MKDTFAMFSVLWARRRTSGQKKRFIAALAAQMKELGRPVRLLEKRLSMWRLFHVLMGEPDNMDVILAAPYDIPDRVFLPGYRYRPGDASSMAAYHRRLLGLQILSAVLFALCAVGSLALYRAAAPWQRAALVALNGILLAVCLALGKGLPNSKNYSEGAALAVAFGSFVDAGPRAGLLLCDASYTTGIGFQQLLADYPALREKRILYLDGIEATGRPVVLHHPEDLAQAKKLAAAIGPDAVTEAVAQASAIAGLPGTLMVCVGVDDGQGRVCLPHVRTPGDCAFDLEQMERIKKGISVYLRGDR